MNEDFESNPVGTAAKLKELEAEIKELNRICTMRGVRMKVMRKFMVDSTAGRYRGNPYSQWRLFSTTKPDVLDWFDENGIPQENIYE